MIWQGIDNQLEKMHALLRSVMIPLHNTLPLLYSAPTDLTPIFSHKPDDINSSGSDVVVVLALKGSSLCFPPMYGSQTPTRHEML